MRHFIRDVNNFFLIQTLNITKPKQEMNKECYVMIICDEKAIFFAL